MNAMAVAQRMTADEYLSLEDPRRTELVEGEVIVHEPAPLHQIVVLDVLREIDIWIRAGSRRGHWIPLDVKLDERNVLAPDLLWYRDGRTLERDRRPPSPLPDLAVEVRSPSTWRYDIGAKKAAYERHGLSELWLVDTAADEVLVFRRSANSRAFDVSLELAAGDELTSPLLPGFALPLRTLFPA
jgi:Uma2 family endonuclease